MEDEPIALNNLAEKESVFNSSHPSRRITMRMIGLLSKLEDFLTLNNREIMSSADKVFSEPSKANAVT